MLPFRLHQGASLDIESAAVYYESSRPGHGEQFLDRVYGAIRLICAFPAIGSPYRGAIRRWNLSRFKYNLFYAREESEIVVYAVAHQSRKPDYWVDRTE